MDAGTIRLVRCFLAWFAVGAFAIAVGCSSSDAARVSKVDRCIARLSASIDIDHFPPASRRLVTVAELRRASEFYVTLVASVQRHSVAVSSSTAAAPTSRFAASAATTPCSARSSPEQRGALTVRFEGCCADGPPRVPGDPEDDERDHDRSPERDDGGAADHSE